MSDQVGHDGFHDVRAELMRPAQLRAARERADVAFLPLGALEWHGLHNPIGVDALASHRVACMAARKLGGGAVFPTLIYSLPRDAFYVDTLAEFTDRIAEAYGTETRRVRGYAPHGGMDMQEQWLNYQRIMRMALDNIAGFGFRSIYIVAGHAPLVHFARPVALAFTRATKTAGQPVTVDWGGHWEPADAGVDHAGRIETSLMMGIDETLADPGELERHPEYVGHGSGANAVESTREEGLDRYEKSAAALAGEAKRMIDAYPNPTQLHRHIR